MSTSNAVKLVVIYQVIFPYRVGVYERLASHHGIEFELLYGKSDQGSKKVNYQGKKLFKSTELTSFYVSYRTNVGASTLQIAPFLFFSLIRRNPDLILTEGASNIVNASIAFL